MTGGPPLASGTMASDGATTPARLSPVQLEPVDKKVLCSALEPLLAPRSPYKQEVNYDMTQSPPAPIMDRALAKRGHSYLPGWIRKYWGTAPVHSPSYKAGQGRIRRPDVVIVKDPSQPSTQDNIKQIIEMTLPSDALSDQQKTAYQKIAGDPDKLLVLEPKDCNCDDPLPGAMLMKYGPEDYIGATLAVRATLYFHGSHTDAVREAICQCFDRYETIAKAHLTWLWREEPPEGPDRSAYLKAKPMRDMFRRMDENDAVSFAYIGGKKPHDASPWLFYVSGLRGWEVKQGGNGLDSLQFSVPRQFIEENPVAFQTLFVDCARLLKAEHGHGGFAFNLSPVRPEANQSTEAVMGSKMAGLDAGNAVLIAGRDKSGITNHIKTVGWLTALNTAMIDTVGGLSTLRSELPRDWFAKYDYGNGIVIQAGPAPELASVEIDAKPATYVLPNQALRAVRIEKIGSLHQGSMDGEPRLTGTAAERWLQRFDIPDTELLAYKAKLLEEPKLTPASILPGAL